MHDYRVFVRGLVAAAGVAGVAAAGVAAVATSPALAQ